MADSRLDPAAVNRWVDRVLASVPSQTNPFAAVDACVAQEMKETDTPGASIAIAVNGVLTYTKGYGVKHAENGGTIDAGTMFRIGSETKMMTAAAVMQQVEAGKVDVNAPVTRYIPEFAIKAPYSADDILVRQTMTHSTGFPDRTLSVDSPVTLSQWAAVQADTPLNAAPGSFWNYSNPNFSLAGLVVERASGIPYRQYMKEHVWNRAGMTLTTMDPEAVMTYGDYAWGHDGQARYAPNAYDNQWAGPAGWAFSTPTEMVRWALLLSHGGGDVLSPASVAEMEARQVSMDYLPGMDYGYGIFVSDYQVVGDPSKHVTMYDHGGNVPGWSGQLFWEPNRGFAVSILANTITSLSGSAACAVKVVAGLEPADPGNVNTDPATWDRYTGTYSMLNVIGMDWTASVTRQQDKLMVDYTDIGGHMSLAQGFLNTFLYQEQGLTLDFTFINDRQLTDRVRWMRYRTIVGQRIGDFPAAVSTAGGACTNLTFTPAFDIPHLAVNAASFLQPSVERGLPITQDDPYDPSKAAFKRSITLDRPGDMFIINIYGQPDDNLDLYVLYDGNKDGQFTFPAEMIWQNVFFISPTSQEGLVLPTGMPAGNYQIWVHGQSVQGENSTFDMETYIAAGDKLRVENPPTAVSAGQPYSVRVCAGDVSQSSSPFLGMVGFDFGDPSRMVEVRVETQRIQLPFALKDALP